MATTIKTGSTPIKEFALMPESFRFDGEPWTPFYMAGEIIRESRKTSRKQSEHASEGNTAYSDEAIDRYKHSRSVDSLPNDDPNVGTGLLGARECGEVLELQMKIKSETQAIEEAEFKTLGYTWAIAVPSLPTELVKGKLSRKHWPSRTRISSASSAFPGTTLPDATRYSRIEGRLHLVGSPIL